MMKVDLSKYQIRTDLAIEALEGVDTKDGIITSEREQNGIKITCVDVLQDGIKLINKKMGRYITMEFEDITDTSRKDNVKKVFSDELRSLLSFLKLKDDDMCLIIGLGNDKSTPDALINSITANAVQEPMRIFPNMTWPTFSGCIPSTSL